MLDAGLNPTWDDLATLMIGPPTTPRRTPGSRASGASRSTPAWSRWASRTSACSRRSSVFPPRREASPWKGLRLGVIRRTRSPNGWPGWPGRAARPRVVAPDLHLPGQGPDAAADGAAVPLGGALGRQERDDVGTRNDSVSCGPGRGRFVLVVPTAEAKSVGIGPATPRSWPSRTSRRRSWTRGARSCRTSRRSRVERPHPNPIPPCVHGVCGVGRDEGEIDSAPMKRFENRVALVTGASRGIGEAIAKRHGAEGASVLAAARSADALAGVVSAIAAAGGRAQALRSTSRIPPRSRPRSSRRSRRTGRSTSWSTTPA
jgi:hypothetical protein